MNKKVSLVVIPKPDEKITQGKTIMGNNGKMDVATYEHIFKDDFKSGYTVIDYYFVDDQPILLDNYYISYENGPTLKYHDETDRLINDGQFKKGERRVYLTEKDVYWIYDTDSRLINKFMPSHLNKIVDSGFICFVKEKDNNCDGEKCANCDCYEYIEENFVPEKYEKKFVIVI